MRPLIHLYASKSALVVACAKSRNSLPFSLPRSQKDVPSTLVNARQDRGDVGGRQGRATASREPAADEPISLDNISFTDAELVEIGAVMGAHGIKGEIKVRPLTNDPKDRLGKGGVRFIRPPKGLGREKPARPIELVKGRKSVFDGDEVFIVTVRGVGSREAAEVLAGSTLYIRSSDRPQLRDEDEFYVQDLVGLKVFHFRTGEYIGTVFDFHDGTGTYDTLRIRLAESDEAGKDVTSLVPFAKAMVPVVDLVAREMRIDPPAGLLDLKRVIEKDSDRAAEARRTPPPTAASQASTSQASTSPSGSPSLSSTSSTSSPKSSPSRPTAPQKQERVSKKENAAAPRPKKPTPGAFGRPTKPHAPPEPE